VPVVGAHVLLYTTEPERLRAMLRDVFGWRHVEDPASEPGWLIFALPPTEVAAHPSEGTTKHELSLICDDVQATKADLEGKGVEFRGEPEDLGFGIAVTMVLPGGVDVLLYEPRHESPLDLQE
jgi:catechol 2,3-dioxygenase-like lactoylglutathione lyase family enzyme